MSFVLRLARITIASTIAEIHYLNARQQLQPRFGIHLYAYSSCQTRLKGDTSQSVVGVSTRLVPTDENTPKEELSSSLKPNTIDKSSLKIPTQHLPLKSVLPNNDTQSQPPPRNLTKPKMSRVAMRHNIKGYFFTRYVEYVKNYDRILEKNFPAACNLYRVFFDGVRSFYADMKRYLKVWRIANNSPKGFRALNRKELELFMQMPRDMVKVAPALIGTSLPMIGYALFPLVFMYPRNFLTIHFWTNEQRAEFQKLHLQERFSKNRPVFRCLETKLKFLQPTELHAELSNIFSLMNNSCHPSVDALIEVKSIFARPPYNMQALCGKHIKLLTIMHGIPDVFSKRCRLTEHAFLVHHMDLAIGREGGAHNMPLDAIQKSCAIRGLNPADISKEEMVDWLQNWITISTSIQEEHISLFLHLPIFLAFNHPNNCKLMYDPKKQLQITNQTESSSK